MSDGEERQRAPTARQERGDREAARRQPVRADRVPLAQATAHGGQLAERKTGGSREGDHAAAFERLGRAASIEQPAGDSNHLGAALLVAAAAITGGDDLDLVSRRAQPARVRSDERPGRIAGLARKRRRDEAELHEIADLVRAARSRRPTGDSATTRVRNDRNRTNDTGYKTVAGPMPLFHDGP